MLKAAGGFIQEDPLIAQYIEKIEGTSASLDGLPLKLLQELINKVILKKLIPETFGSGIFSYLYKRNRATFGCPGREAALF